MVSGGLPLGRYNLQYPLRAVAQGCWCVTFGTGSSLKAAHLPSPHWPEKPSFPHCRTLGKATEQWLEEKPSVYRGRTPPKLAFPLQDEPARDYLVSHPTSARVGFSSSHCLLLSKCSCSEGREAFSLGQWEGANLHPLPLPLGLGSHSATAGAQPPLFPTPEPGCQIMGEKWAG